MASNTGGTGPRPVITAEGLSTQIPDIDPDETS